MSVHILDGDCRDILPTLESESVDCVVTSPPYWGLRDYGVESQMGLEPTLDEHLSAMVDVFTQVHRVLKKEGTLWINYGDCYATTPNGRSAADTKAAGNDDRTFRDKPFSTIGGVLKAKDLCMVPNRLAIALQEAGWWVRSEIIWAKPNPMPESIRDRPATSHEKIFMLSKSARYWYDADAVRIESDWNPEKTKFPDGWETGPGTHGTIHSNGREKGKPMKAVGGQRKRGTTPRHKAHIQHTTLDNYPSGEGRNLRNYEPAPLEIWNIATKPFSEAHFATFPPELAARCIKAGCPKGGLVLDPFGGAGTVGLVADGLDRDALLIELNAGYNDISEKRITGASPMFVDVERKSPETQNPLNLIDKLGKAVV